MESNFQAVKSGQDHIEYLMIINKLFFPNQSNHHPIRSIFLVTSQLYSAMEHANENTTDCHFRFRNSQKVNEACNGSLITKGLQEHGMKNLYPLHVTGFDALRGDDKK